MHAVTTVTLRALINHFALIVMTSDAPVSLCARCVVFASVVLNFMQTVPFARNVEGEVAFIGHQKKEMTMDNSNGAPGANTTPAETARRLKDAATQVVDRGREAAMAKVQDTVHQGAERARTSAESTSGALRRAAADLQDDNAWIGSGLRRAADFLDQASGQIGQGDLNQLVDGVNTFARRNPALFLGASLAAGFLIARLGKTALEGEPEQQGLPDGQYNPGFTTDGTPGL